MLKEFASINVVNSMTPYSVNGSHPLPCYAKSGHYSDVIVIAEENEIWTAKLHLIFEIKDVLDFVSHECAVVQWYENVEKSSELHKYGASEHLRLSNQFDVIPANSINNRVVLFKDFKNMSSPEYKGDQFFLGRPIMYSSAVTDDDNVLGKFV